MKMQGVAMRAMPGMMSCAQFDEFICNYLDGKLPLWQRLKFKIHLGMCKDCRHFLAAYKTSIELQQRILRTPDAPVPDDVPEDLVQAILKTRKSRLDK